jgi:hypothetical protein
VATHATITPNAGGAVVVPRYRIVHLVRCRPTPPYHSFDGVRVHATIACFFSASFWFPADNISIFRRDEPVQNLTRVFFYSNFHPNLIKQTAFFYSNLHYI